MTERGTVRIQTNDANSPLFISLVATTTGWERYSQDWVLSGETEFSTTGWEAFPES